METDTMKPADIALSPEGYNRHVKVHPKYLFALIGFGLGSTISLIVIVAEELHNDVSVITGNSQLHHLAIPILFGFLGMMLGYILGKKKQTREEAFREVFANQQTMSLILDHLPLLISYLDNDLRYRYANKTYEKWMGLSIKDIYGKPVKAIVAEKTYGKLLEHLTQARQGKIVRFETVREMGGKERFLHALLVPHLGDNKSVKGFFSIVADVTRLRKRERKIKKQKEHLETLNATKDKFFSIIAHDLKNPFGSILGISELLSHDYDALEENQVREFIDLLYESSQNTYKLLENLLEWSRSQSGVIQYNPSVTDIKALVDENILLFQPVADRKKIRLKSHITESIEVTTDQDLVTTVVRNLLSNALKFTSENGEVSIAAIRYTDEQEKKTIEISVTDTGIGISPENQKNLFKLGKKYASTGTSGEPGTGLGLILCNEFVEKCGGKIGVESEIGKGSVFRIYLPLN